MKFFLLIIINYQIKLFRQNQSKFNYEWTTNHLITIIIIIYLFIIEIIIIIKIIYN